MSGSPPALQLTNQRRKDMASAAREQAVRDLNRVHRERMAAAIPAGGASPALQKAIADLNGVQADKMAEQLKDGVR
jgi:hypothetical protein